MDMLGAFFQALVKAFFGHGPERPDILHTCHSSYIGTFLTLLLACGPADFLFSSSPLIIIYIDAVRAARALHALREALLGVGDRFGVFLERARRPILFHIRHSHTKGHGLSGGIVLELESGLRRMSSLVGVHNVDGCSLVLAPHRACQLMVAPLSRALRLVS